MKNTMEMNNKLNTEELTKVAGGTGPLDYPYEGCVGPV